MEIHQKTNQYESKDVSKYLWIILTLILSGGYVWGEHVNAEVETRQVPSIFDYRGHIINNQPVLIDEHCYHTPNKD